MRRKRYITAAMAAAAVVILAFGSGCQKKYEQIQLDGVESGAEAGEERTGEKAEDGGDFGTGTSRDDTSPGSGADLGDGEQEQQAQTSLKEQNMVGEPVPELQDVDETVYVSGDLVNLRESASTASRVVAVFNKGDKLHRTGYGEQWSRVQYEGMTCYIASRYVSNTVQVPEEGSGQEAEDGQGTASQTNAKNLEQGDVAFNPSWKYGEFSKISSGTAKLYKSQAGSPKGITVCVNAGHGTSGGSSVKTLCHPDGTPKVTGGTTGAGATSAVAVSGGMTFSDGTAEAKVTLAMGKKLKEKLLAAGYDVLMIRESDDVQLDNIARTVMANNCADCHIALHWDSTASNKGAFYMSVPNVSSYRNMEPVKSNWEKHNALGESLVAGLKSAGVKIFSGGSMEMDLTQTSFSTIPSVDIELGDKASDHSDAALDILASGLVAGIDQYFGR